MPPNVASQIKDFSEVSEGCGVPLGVEVELQVAHSTQIWKSLVSFTAGAAYGLTSVAVGQPFDTIKTRMQAKPDAVRASAWRVGAEILQNHGPLGLYRGGLPVVLGGTMFRSAQFGFYDFALRHLRSATPPYKIGFLDWQIALAGAMGGFARGVIEAPFDLVKVCRQVEHAWSFRTLLHGSSVTIVRNMGLFSSFSIYRDILSSLNPAGIPPFWMGAICSNMAWLTIWPLDVIKSQRQSGNFDSKSCWTLLTEAARTGLLFRGLAPGLLRSTLANGTAMVAYKKVEEVADVTLPQWR